MARMPRMARWLADYPDPQGLPGLKNIWPVIMIGDLLSIIFSPAVIPI